MKRSVCTEAVERSYESSQRAEMGYEEFLIMVQKFIRTQMFQELHKLFQKARR